MKKSALAAIAALLALSPAGRVFAGWDGLYAGLYLGSASSTFTADYEHSRMAGCSSLNFGAEWPGTGCEGNQDYATGGGGTDRSSQIGLSVERLRESGGRVLGWQVNLAHLDDPRMAISEVISTTWGDTLDVEVIARSSLDLRVLYGLPSGEWLPFVSLGAGLQQITPRYTQVQVGYPPAVIRSGDDWALSAVAAVGVKRDLGQNWVLSTEVSVSATGPARLSQEAVVLGGGLTYPDTDVTSRLSSTLVRIGISRRF